MPSPTTSRDRGSRTYTRPRLPIPALTKIHRHADNKSDSLEIYLRRIGSLGAGALRSIDPRSPCTLDASGFPHPIVDNPHNSVGKTSAFACPTAFPYITAFPKMAGRSSGSATCMGRLDCRPSADGHARKFLGD